jgi:membrane protein
MHRSLEAITQWLKRVITQPREELDRYQKAVRFAYDLSRFGARQLNHDRADQMAAALSFRTLFGLLPVLVVATVLVKALGLEEHYLEPLGRLFQFWGLDSVRIIPPGAAADAAEATISLSTWLSDRVREAEQVNIAAIGWMGVAITLYAAIGLMVTIENCFNHIYHAPEGRPWTSRVPVYWFVLTLSPLLIVLSTYVDGRFQELMSGLAARGWLSTTVGVLWSVFAIWLVMLAVYALFPNTRVHLRPAMAGALVAAVLLEFGKRTMGLYLQNALSISQLYGSLGLIPLFMFWVYLMWLAVLFGLEVSAILQHLRGRRLAELQERRSDPALVEPAMVTLIMKQIAQGFAAGRATTLEQVAETTQLPPPIVERILDRLAVAGWLHRLSEPEESVTLSRPPETIPVRRLLDVGFALVERDTRDDGDARLLDELRAAQQQAAGDAHLGSLL